MRLSRLGLCGLLALVISCGDDDDSWIDGGKGGNTTPGPYDAVPVSNTVNIANLTGHVDAVRDKYGMVHIHATSTTDALRVEGYQVARDRTSQLELIRRSAEGKTAELFGDVLPSLIDDDISMRNIGLARVAAKMLDLATPEEKAQLDAYADGISQFNARVVTGDEPLPPDMLGISQNAFQPWTAVDVLAVARFQALNLAYDAEGEISLTEAVESARAKFNASATDPNLAKRKGILLDTIRFQPVEKATPLDGFPNDLQNTLSHVRPTKQRIKEFHPNAEALIATKAWRHAVSETRKLIGDRKVGITGSNNWVVGKEKTATGHPMLASDPHLTLSAPAVFWMVHVTVDSPTDPLDFAGLSFPGIPGVILGFNKNVAWGATTADFDVTDVYEETLTGGGVTFKGATVPFERVQETINVAGKPPVPYEVLIVPHHGPIVPNIQKHAVVPPADGQKALSVKWTGHQPTKDLSAILGIIRAKNVDDARTAMSNFAIGAQNWVFADTAGNTFYTSHALIPKRDKAAYTWDPATFSGKIPCLVLPGDGSAEWTGQFLEDAYIPHVKNPAKGYLATANTEQVGTTLDNDPTNDKLPNGEPMYMGCWHDPGFRLARIQQRIEGVGHPMTLDDMASIQGDARSAMGAKLTAQILASITAGEAEATTPGSHPDLTALVSSSRWGAGHIAEIKTLLTNWANDDYEAAAGVSLDAPYGNVPDKADASKATSILNAWVTRMIPLVFEDEWALGGGSEDSRKTLIDLMTIDKSTLATFDATMNDSILFDDLRTPAVETRDERVLHALLDSVDFLTTRFGSSVDEWRWGKLHTIRFASLVALWRTLSIPIDTDPAFPRHGDGYNVDVGGYNLPSVLDATTSFGYSHGPTQRFVIDMDPAGPVARNALPGGNVWASADPHFRDEAERWRRNQNRPVPFLAADVVANAEGRVVYESK